MVVDAVGRVPRDGEADKVALVGLPHGPDGGDVGSRCGLALLVRDASSLADERLHWSVQGLGVPEGRDQIGRVHSEVGDVEERVIHGPKGYLVVLRRGEQVAHVAHEHGVLDDGPGRERLVRAWGVVSLGDAAALVLARGPRAGKEELQKLVEAKGGVHVGWDEEAGLVGHVRRDNAADIGMELEIWRSARWGGEFGLKVRSMRTHVKQTYLAALETRQAAV